MLPLNGTIGTKGPQSNRCDRSVKREGGREGKRRETLVKKEKEPT